MCVNDEVMATNVQVQYAEGSRQVFVLVLHITLLHQFLRKVGNQAAQMQTLV
jgi:hypothetical protein